MAEKNHSETIHRPNHGTNAYVRQTRPYVVLRQVFVKRQETGHSNRSTGREFCGRRFGGIMVSIRNA